MRITLTRHGGLLAGMKRPPRIIDVTSLDPGRAERLLALVASALGAQRDREVAADASAVARSAMADGMSYAITIEDEGRVVTLKQAEPTESSPFADLLEFIEHLP
jgi:emfourin